MTEPNRGVDYDADTPLARELWEALEGIQQPEPPARLRHAFYRRLDRMRAPGAWSRRLRGWFAGPWVPAAAMLAVGLMVGAALERPDGELAALREQVAVLHRDVTLSLMHHQSASERLRGVIGAGELAADDPGVTRALLRQALDDPSHAVRAAAIDALGPRVRSPEVGGEVLGLLEAGVSPLVQKALVDLILRHGGPAELERLLELADRGDVVHPDLGSYVTRSVTRSSA